MNLESFGEELRRHREQKQVSLAAISEATRISEKMLESIEAGKFSVLPQAYIRAFLRAYARALDMDPDEILRRYDDVNQEIRSVAEEWVNRSKVHPVRVERDAAAASPSPSRISLPSIIVAVVILAAVSAVIYFANRESAIPSQEPLSMVPFDKAIHETEATTAQPEPQPQRPVQPPVVDSLRLEMSTTDSVWLSITIDDVQKREYLFPAGRTRTWVADKQFLISMGNAGAATFLLNGRSLGVLGKRGAVARNVVITRSGVQQAQ